MSDWPILSTVTFLPLVGALLIVVIRGDDESARRNIYWTALWTTLITFVLSLFIWARFNPADPKPMPKFPMTPPLPDTAPGLRDAGKVVRP